MASQLAQILNDYRRTMPEAGAGMEAGSRAILGATVKKREQDIEANQNKITNYFKLRQIQRAEDKSGRETEQFKLEQLAGVVAAAKNDPKKWKEWQDNGDIPPDLKPDDADRVLMATVIGRAKLDRDLKQKQMSQTQANADRTYGLNKQKESRMAQESADKKQLNQAKLRKAQAEVKKIEQETGRPLEIRQDPLGLEFMVLDKTTKQPLFKIDSDGGITNINGQGPNGGGVIPYEEYFK